MINRKRVERYLPYAVDVLREEYGEGGMYPNALKGYIASFGAAMTLGHWQAAIAFYSKKGDATISKEKVTELVIRIVKKVHTELPHGDLMRYARDNPKSKKEIMEMVVALKLALNLFEAKQEGTDDKEQRA